MTSGWALLAVNGRNMNDLRRRKQAPVGSSPSIELELVAP